MKSVCLFLISSLTIQDVISRKRDLRSPRPSNDIEEFRKLVKNASHIVVITGAGISADSGVPTYEGSWGMWRGFPSHMLDNEIMFSQKPEVVWEFNQFRRHCVLQAKPNMAHIALAKYERFLNSEGKGRKLTVITQNIDELHTKAGSKNVIEMHGSLFRTKCVSCGHIEMNRKNPICPVLKGRGNPLPGPYPKIKVNDLPHCTQPNCTGLLRPHIVWYGEPLLKDSIEKAEVAIKTADLGLLVGTSSKVMPVAFYAPSLANRGVHVAEFNLEPVAAAGSVTYYFEGSCADTLPEVFKQ